MRLESHDVNGVRFRSQPIKAHKFMSATVRRKIAFRDFKGDAKSLNAHPFHAVRRRSAISTVWLNASPRTESVMMPAYIFGISNVNCE